VSCTLLPLSVPLNLDELACFQAAVEEGDSFAALMASDWLQDSQVPLRDLLLLYAGVPGTSEDGVIGKAILNAWLKQTGDPRTWRVAECCVKERADDDCPHADPAARWTVAPLRLDAYESRAEAMRELKAQVLGWFPDALKEDFRFHAQNASGAARAFVVRTVRWAMEIRPWIADLIGLERAVPRRPVPRLPES
jgi:hypothetical protein